MLNYPRKVIVVWMGVLKKLGIAVAVIVGLFVIISLAAGASYLAEKDAEASKYAGLTEEQITNVKILWERCETSAYMAGMGSDTATERALEKCKEVEAKKIAEYRAQNAM